MTYPEDLEAPEADAAEQATVVDPDEEAAPRAAAVGDDVPEWDAQEQALEVPVDDDYR